MGTERTTMSIYYHARGVFVVAFDYQSGQHCKSKYGFAKNVIHLGNAT